MYGDTTVQVGVIPRLVDPYGLQDFSSEKMGFCSNDFRSLPVYSVFLVPCMYYNTVLPIPLFLLHTCAQPVSSAMSFQFLLHRQSHNLSMESDKQLPFSSDFPQDSSPSSGFNEESHQT